MQQTGWVGGWLECSNDGGCVCVCVWAILGRNPSPVGKQEVCSSSSSIGKGAGCVAGGRPQRGRAFSFCTGETAFCLDGVVGELEKKQPACECAQTEELVDSTESPTLRVSRTVFYHQ
mmetsp:Transcript_8577/g.18569  ORF Transcript_8577/g.18569 Transcript_8577/m.18569 type:complete len:118 (+) Transcript_8577:249-602(+)